MDDEELEAIRRRKLLELQAQLQAEEAAAYERAAEEEAMRAQRDALLRQIFTPEARARLANIRMARPDFAATVEDQILILVQAGRIPVPVTDEFLRRILQQLQGRRRDITIKRV
ncbi:MAG TPA: DNA-binding protein [Thermoplasmata archaeon]|nr:DNA-binding protein [Thermoplasmata archaeon]